MLPVPRELGDEIYRHALSITYLVKLYPTSAEKLRNESQPPKSPRYANFFEQSSHALLACEMQQSQTCEKYRYKAAVMARTWGYGKSANGLSLLRTSSNTYEEAAAFVFPRSTFFFQITQPHEPLPNHFPVEQMDSIHVHIDLLQAYLRHWSLEDEVWTFECPKRLIYEFGKDRIERDLCVISIDRGERTTFLLQPTFIEVIISLSRFRTVALRLTPAFKDWLEPERDPPSRYSEVLRSLRRQDIRTLKDQNKYLEFLLGPNEVDYEREDFLCLVYHPLSYNRGSQRPVFDINDLADPPDPALLSPVSVSP